MATAAPHTPTRVLNYGTGPPKDGLEREWDTCPGCGQPRWQLIIMPDRFHCDKCEKAGPGPNTEVAESEPEQIELQVNSKPVQDLEVPPIDEADAWMAEEMPDE